MLVHVDMQLDLLGFAGQSVDYVYAYYPQPFPMHVVFVHWYGEYYHLLSLQRDTVSRSYLAIVVD